MEFYNFIESHKDLDPNKLRLSINKNKFDFDVDFAINQIECRKKHWHKLSQYISYPHFLFPDSISAEQASHQAIGRFHASLLCNEQTILDMTAGLGIDSFSFAKKNIIIDAIELNPHKAEILKNNASELNLDSIRVINGNSIDYLKNTTRFYDLIFVDPSRRDSSNKRVYNLHDCSPDIITNQELLISKTKRVFIKASPLLDITQTLKDFDNIASIKAVGIKGECKEILIILEADKVSSCPILIEAINLDNDGNIISQFSDTGSDAQGNISYACIDDLKPGIFILEPSAMIMKISPWESLCRNYNALKMGKSSHLFISDTLPDNFPGRVTKFGKILSKAQHKQLEGFPASVVSKNHPLSASEIRKKLKLKEGDKNYIYATRVGDKPVLLLSNPV